MCGFVVQSGKHDPTKFTRAVQLTDHRGVRGRIEMSKGGVMAHTRLPIVGLGESHDQPMRRWAMGRECLIAFVGEVLDFRERDPLAECDAEVVAQAWMKRGPQALRGRDGFWSVAALWDDGTLELLCDYLGQKPIYYRADVRAAASEPDAVAVLAPVTPDEIYFSSVMKWGYCPEVERTPYREVKHVLPGEHVLISPSGAVSRKVVDVLVPRVSSPEELKAEIEAAVKRRVLSSDVTVACLLSGGLDSSIVYTLACRYSSVTPYYVGGTSSDDAEEWEAVKSVAPQAVRDFRLVVARDDVRASWDQQLDIMQEPVDLGSLVPQIALSLAVGERVCLTGDGADECFGGYGRSARYDSQASDLFQELPAWHLPRLDRVMMRRRIETRSPFLARRVVEMAMGLHHGVRTDKLILRDLFEANLPPGLARRKKIPMRTPVVEKNREWVSQSLVSKFKEMKWPRKLQFDQPNLVLSG